MSTEAEQTTIARPVTKTGIGLHTGERCVVSLRPAESDAGIVFAVQGEAIPATAEHVVDTVRGTTLGRGNARIGCVEHLMAALYGLGPDNIRVDVEGPEIPACDGSALEWVKALRKAGRTGVGAPRRIAEVSQAVIRTEGESWLMAGPGRGGLRLAVGVEYPNTVAGKQGFWLALTPTTFARELAPARTFAVLEEVEGLRARGLARGGGESNAFAVGREGYSGPLRFEDEVVRHKMLDLVGDLALCGYRLRGQIVAIRPGHRANVGLARDLRAMLVS